jgi:hypothetical protein
MKYKPTEVALYGSGPVDLLNIRVEQIDFGWIADRLSKIPRFLGGTVKPYSVAQHSVWVCNNVHRDVAPWALLHDAHEALTGDIIRPVRRALDALWAKEGHARLGDQVVSGLIDKLGENINARIYQAAGLPRAPTRQIADAVAFADNYACEVEIATLINGDRRIGAPHPVSQEHACSQFLLALKHLCPGARGLP